MPSCAKLRFACLEGDQHHLLLQAHKGKLWKAFLGIKRKRKRGYYKQTVAQATEAMAPATVRSFEQYASAEQRDVLVHMPGQLLHYFLQAQVQARLSQADCGASDGGHVPCCSTLPCALR